jgi:hypothetical protein
LTQIKGWRRKCVEAYVPYIHYVEGLWQAASTPAEHHHH